MRKIISYIAQSLDGKIAGKDGGVDWLEIIPKPEKTDYGYQEFYNSIDTTIMGNKTYQQVLGFDIPFPYQDKKNYVLTHDASLEKDDHVEYVHGNRVSFFQKLKQKEGKDIWLIGGGQVNTFFLKHRLIDELLIFTMPVLLGKGIQSFEENHNIQLLKVTKSQTYSNGVVFTQYKIKK